MSRPHRSVPKPRYKENSGSESENEGFSSSSSSLLSGPPHDNLEESPSEILSFPTATEIADIRTSIQEEEKTLELIRIEYEITRKAIETIEAKRRRIADRLKANRYSLSTVKILPLEVLGYIFKKCVLNNFDSPWTLMHVCRAWRNAARQAYDIWGGILMQMPFRRRGNWSRVDNGRQICFSKKHLELALKRAGNAPLHIEIVPRIFQRRHYPLSKTHFPSMLSLFLSLKKDVRIQTLTISWEEFGDCLKPDHFKGFNFANVQFFAIPYDAKWDALLSCVNTAATHLRSLACSASKASLESFAHWSKLEKLSLSTTSVEETEKALAQCCALRSLTLWGHGCKWWALGSDISEPSAVEAMTLHRVEKTSLTHFHSLQTLTLEGSSVFLGEPPTTDQQPTNTSTDTLSSILFPSLNHLQLNGPSRIVDQSTHVIELPSLSFLGIDRDMKKLQNLHAPLLYTLKLSELHYSKSEIGKSFRISWSGLSQHTAPNPVVLRLERSSLYPPDLVAILPHMSRLEEFHSVRTALPVDFFVAMGKRYLNGKPSTRQEAVFLCASLRKISVDLVSAGSLRDPAVIFAAASKLVNRREKPGICRIEEGSIRFTENEGWLEFTP